MLARRPRVVHPPGPALRMNKLSPPSRSSRALVAALAALTAAADAHAGTDSDVEVGLMFRHRQSAPLAISGDGRWRVHVDAAGVLHRVELATGRESGRVQLPPGALHLVASNDARRVLVRTSGGCVGRIDIDQPEPHRAAWLNPAEGGALDAAGEWTDSPAEGCDGNAAEVRPDQGLALSSDGRLAAIGATTVDLGTHRVVARLPRAPYWSAFADGDTRWLAAGVIDNERDESSEPPSESWSASWNLRTGLLDQVGLMGSSATGRGLVDTGWAAGSDEWHDFAGLSHDSLHVRTLSRSDCAAAPRLARWAPSQWFSAPLAWDPLGRWVAVMAGDQETAHDQLEVFDMATGRQLMHRRFGHELHGLTASPDGTHLMGIVAPLPASAESKRPPPVSASEMGSVLTLDIPVGAATPAPPRPASPAVACERPAGAIAAQRVERRDRVLPVAWSLNLPVATTEGSSATWPPAPVVLRRNDGSLWLDRGTDLARVDPGTGRVLETLPTPRSGEVRSIVIAGTPAEGFVNAQGDTLTWRPLDQAQGKVRRHLDTRPGMRVLAMAGMGRSAAVLWVPKGATPETAASWRVSVYDVSTGRVKHSAPVDPASDLSEAFAQGLVAEQTAPPLPPCAADRQTPSARYDWHIDTLGAATAHACGAAGSAELVLWAGVDASPGAASVGHRHHRGARIFAADESIAAVRDEDGELYVLDATAHAELGRLAPSSSDAAVLSATSRVLLVQQTSDDADGPHIVIEAYRLP